MDVAEELTDTETKVDRVYVERRLDDWRRRLDDLYSDIAGWLPDGWALADGGTVPIREELMQRLGVPEQRLPVKGLLRGGIPTGRLEPRGLWIIGANGRVDLVLPHAHYLIVDRTDSFELPNWQIASIESRREQRHLDRNVILEIFQ